MKEFDFTSQTNSVDFTLCNKCGRRCILDLYFGIFRDDFLGKTLSVKVDISAALQDIGPNVLILVDGMSLTG